ncbi:helix-turn-helix transcriptional regulator [Enterobacter hormaechei]|jgi:transcriptional regulator with XRE-family HTH domain|uniref:helix-turn-helix domain-containing protein n=1 Tax=Enterobacter hormaechei TaxID=158836 RepID=UPI000795EBE1|nr:helix-turn-helix transcriptional regulator [Enterobacter hormaechei]ELC6295484.1 helix-turn-helix transcriptional regulator [Enterobacter hormaechei]ELC6541236.1 helix-turn-helix transcriptional regulator [Enterobacter hormaechei]MBG0545222.1 helix-turn-helix transcriptional regulator [Enterobacter hormaechei]MCM7630264.1 helix-turn-helix domain-containing protein [Enterobacter hormaechei]MCM7777760.1 helix-turn-helix domain-containing protein [Enterobacter hormaechei]
MIPKRLKEARLRAKLTQEKLGVLAGIEEATAYSRLSHYENGTHKPTFELVCEFARVLDVPECYFYTVDDELANLIVLYWREKYANRQKIISFVKDI